MHTLHLITIDTHHTPTTYSNIYTLTIMSVYSLLYATQSTISYFCGTTHQIVLISNGVWVVFTIIVAVCVV